ncbi:FAD-linked oxidase C-terminal domain-containing protein [Tsukamurella sp. NPDC003166]|uniref:FAD-binding oxidoreductase n=1 Tax=Tsukamurella sp. NPDC003166 TaxID=3154444 RepID=UPI0033AD6866
MTARVTVVDELRARIGAAVVTDPAVLQSYRSDRSGAVGDGSPLGVVFAESTDDVAAVLAIAERTRTPVVTRGAGTGLAGGASAAAGELVLSTERMTGLLEVSRADRIARVSAGVLSADVDAAAVAVGLRYTPDPGSVAISTIGGNIATNAGGLRCVKYGVTRDSVLGLEVVLPGGGILHTGGRTIKGVAGLDLTSLIVGSEGTLGVVTEATLRLRSVSPVVHTVVGLFPSTAAAAAGVTEVLEAGDSPLVAELLDGTCLLALDRWKGTSFGRGALAMIQFEGNDGAHACDVVARLWARSATEVTVADDGGGALVAARRDALPALERLGRVLIEDVAVPLSQVGTMIERVERIATEFGVTIATMAHAGDGNLHPIIVVDEPGIPDRAWRAADAVFRAALDLGGTLTGEHGVGLLKQRWLRSEIGDVSTDLTRGIKSVFDPNGILNPGKALG